MKTLSKKCKYALQALYGLSAEYGKAPVLISTLSEKQRIPHKFLEVILWELKQRGLVESKKGKHGGYWLAKAPDTITIGSIIRMIDGPLAPLPCASETAYRQCDECNDVAKCGTRIVMREVRNAMAAILDHKTLADVCSTVEKLHSADEDREALMYYI
ncbi:MAG TPA: Rrf2 family transcriptional regulator [Bryobacteraceae bacterium]|jgi:Rrf2 family protein|nr:Rrf2 family transcriptional regulator [Bryobacteraceae bacterium]